MYTVLSAVVGSTALAPYCVYANTSAANFQMREQVVDLVGIMSVTDATAQVSRADFAEIQLERKSDQYGGVGICRCTGFPSKRHLYPDCRFPGLDDRISGRTV